MIIDAVANLHHYTKLFPNIPEALEAMNRIEQQEFGKKYFFEGGYFFFQEGATKPIEETQFEAHRNFVDLQIVLEGEEYIAWNKIDDLTEAIPYNAEKDVQKFTGKDAHKMKMSEGMAYICFPWDGHKAVFHVDQPLHFKKAVIKLALN
ncbi:YhcH/YjgK/YiaL family protein [Enterococcus raffinosus]|uniref:YhcH/YjgK/YiaL family protein n=1 Tax=Enterococcus raffinosus TaxID=71452 RepID=UPI001C129458|nr:YhcH/YjgK/YiaL family protein [Enterococcus raffinosus]MBU5360093.1 YhcH/YjgK/YiaL family protein [Enterococcus raffinosus]